MWPRKRSFGGARIRRTRGLDEPGGTGDNGKDGEKDGSPRGAREDHKRSTEKSDNSGVTRHRSYPSEPESKSRRRRLGADQQWVVAALFRQLSPNSLPRLWISAVCLIVIRRNNPHRSTPCGRGNKYVLDREEPDAFIKRATRKKDVDQESRSIHRTAAISRADREGICSYNVFVHLAVGTATSRPRLPNYWPLYIEVEWRSEVGRKT